MVLRFLLLLVMLSSLDAKEKNWYDKIHPSIEAGMHLSDFEGTLDNIKSNTDFNDDFYYSDTSSSYFALDVKIDYDFVPNIKLSYFNDKQNKHSILSSYTEVADGVFDANSTASTRIDYQVFNVVLYKDFKRKGTRVKVPAWRFLAWRFSEWKFYPGDFELDLGVNLKIINWKFQITKTPTEEEFLHWVIVDEKIPLPFVGFKYFYYNLKIFAYISALSFSDAKSTNYELGVDYKIINNFYLSASYMYEDFEAVEEKNEHSDTIKFRTIGNKFGFKYTF